ncbi:MAG: D-alanine--D-alanine ligase [Saprospiraceae bacterium]|nr:D-alanine--D-alanine ligase [Saprospiraceae bacterium]
MHIAIIAGGPSAERGISEKSAQLLLEHLDASKYTWRLISVDTGGWFDQESGEQMDLNDFSLTVKGNKESFDFAFLMIHGTPAEDGKMQGYLEMQKIPHSTCDTLSASLTFNKQKCKDYLKAYNIPLAPSILLKKKEPWDIDLILSLGLPVFIKPNSNGSSYGVSKVKNREEIKTAIDAAYKFDDELIVEAFLAGREFGCGVVREGKTIHALPITEIIPQAEFFTYEAKYEGASTEITPAELSQELTEKCQNLSKELYQILSCKGVVRFDYILKNDTFYLLEANTIPGMSAQSIVPQQARAYGWSIRKLLDVIIEDALAYAT